VAQLSLSGLKLLQLRRVRRRFVWIKLYPANAGPRVCHFDESRFLEIGRTRNCVYQIWNQIGAPLIDVLHLRPALIDTLLQANEAIIAAAEPDSDNDDDE